MLGEKLTAKLRSLPASDIKTALITAALLSGLNAIWVIWESADIMYRIHKLSEAGICTFGMTLPFRSIRIGLFLVVAFIALRSRKARGFYVSLLSLSWVCTEYWFWHVESQRILVNADIPRFPAEIPHAFNLYGATDWNVIVLLISSVLLIWEIKVLLSVLISLCRKKVC